MVRGSARKILLPAAGFALLLALSLWSIDRAEGRPERSLYLAARQYLDALGQGDLEAALARVDGIPTVQDARLAAQRRSWLGHVTRLEVAPGGLGGETVVTWSHAERGRGGRERLLWTRRPDGVWRIRLAERLPTRTPRRS